MFTPLLSRLAAEAPGVRLKIAPPAGDYVERLRRNQVDLVVMPREVFTDYGSFPHQFLFSDRFVCAVDAGHPDVGETISLEQFSSLPYLATSCGHEVSPAEAQLDQLGITRNTEVTTAFGLAPILLSGTRMIALLHERLARTMALQTSLRLLEPPMPLLPINQLMLWNAHADADPAHQWLRQQLMAMAAELDRSPAAAGGWRSLPVSPTAAGLRWADRALARRPRNGRVASARHPDARGSTVSAA